MFWRSIVMTIGLGVSVTASGAENPAPQPMDHTYVKLFQAVPNGAWEDTSDERLKTIARDYYWINSHAGSWLKGSAPENKQSAEGLARMADGDVDWRYFAGPSAGRDANGKTVGERLREFNPKIILTNYRNGAYTNQNAVREAGEIERRIPMSIAVHDTHTSLTQALSTDETTILLRPPSKVPEGQPATYPFIASTTKEQYSKDKKEFVAWFRLDDEIMRIDEVQSADGKIQLTVVRGYWGTKAAPHAADAVVLQPIYNGSRGRDREYGLSGLPNGNSPQRGLRYVMNQGREEFWNFLAEKSQEILDEGYNGPWFDCTASTWINHSNACGVSVKQQGAWDPELKRNMDPETYREYQQRKIDYLFERWPGREIYVNWFFPRTYFSNGTEKLMFSGANGHKPISGGAIEMYANPGNMEWLPLMDMQLDMTRNNYRHISWVKAADMSEKYMLFAYATHLMIHQNGTEQYWGREGDPFNPNPFLYYDLGEPLQTFQKIDEAQLEEVAGVYGRQFDKGLVLVNPDMKQAKSVKLDDTMFDAVSRAWVSEVSLEPRAGVVLIMASSDGTSEELAATQPMKQSATKPAAASDHNRDLERVMAE